MKSSAKKIKHPAIPPAWKRVRISKNPNAKIIATGFDSKNRKQYIYNPKFRQKQETIKYKRMLSFARKLPQIRACVRRDLKRTRLDLRKVSAAVVFLMEATLIRVGNEEYAKKNRSFGLTTLQDHHVKFGGGQMKFEFKGKSNIKHSISLKDQKIAPIVKRCRDLPGQDLFQYVDQNGQIHDIKSSHINSYIRAACGQSFSAKDFRTWAGTVLAAAALKQFKKIDSKAAVKRQIRDAIETVAKKLGNTPTICKKCYIHPEIFNFHLAGKTLTTVSAKIKTKLKGKLRGLSAHEGAVLAILNEHT